MPVSFACWQACRPFSELIRSTRTDDIFTVSDLLGERLGGEPNPRVCDGLQKDVVTSCPDQIGVASHTQSDLCQLLQVFFVAISFALTLFLGFGGDDHGLHGPLAAGSLVTIRS